MATPLTSRLRSKLGKAKEGLLNRFYYNKKLEEAKFRRDELRSSIAKLPSVADTKAALYEIHMICGQRDLDMGIWSSWSIMRFLEGNGKLYVHSDGSLTQADINTWTGVISGAEFISRDSANEKSHAFLTPTCPNLLEWRNSWGSFSTSQVIDAHLYGTAKHILVMDSDVLCFKPPIEVMRSLESLEPNVRWCKDLQNAYVAAPHEIETAIGYRIPPKLNCGFITMPRFTLEDFEFIDRLLVSLGDTHGINMRRFWAAQTLYAVMAGKIADAKELPAPYSNAKGSLSSETIIRHFVGIPRVRHLFFNAAVPKLVSELR